MAEHFHALRSLSTAELFGGIAGCCFKLPVTLKSRQQLLSMIRVGAAYRGDLPEYVCFQGFAESWYTDLHRFQLPSTLMALFTIVSSCWF